MHPGWPQRRFSRTQRALLLLPGGTFARVLAADRQTDFHLFSIFFLPFHPIGGSCLSNKGSTLGKQVEGGRQGRNSRGKRCITPRLVSERDGAVLGAAPLRQGSARPEQKLHEALEP